MANKKSAIPNLLRNKLQRSREPLLADLQGPGPFLLPLLTNVESILEFDKGGIEIRLETKSAQEVRIQLTEEAASTLQMTLTVHESRKTSQTPGTKKH